MASRKRSPSGPDDDDERDEEDEDVEGEYETFKKWLDENAPSSSTALVVPPKPVTTKCGKCGWETCKWISSWLDEIKIIWDFGGTFPTITLILLWFLSLPAPNLCPGAEIQQRMIDVRDAIAKKKLELEKRAKGILMLSSVLQGWACGIVPNCDTSNPKQLSIYKSYW